MFNKLTIHSYIHIPLKKKTLSFLKKFKYTNIFKNNTKMYSTLYRLNFSVFRSLRRDEEFEKHERKCMARAFRRYKHKHFLRQNKISMSLVPIKNYYNYKKIKSIKIIHNWIKFPFAFKTTKTLTFVKGRQLLQNEVYLTFKNFTNLVFSIIRIVEQTKYSPKKHLLLFFLKKKRKLSIPKIVNNMVSKIILK